jgi:hypothetical protein
MISNPFTAGLRHLPARRAGTFAIAARRNCACRQGTRSFPSGLGSFGGVRAQRVRTPGGASGDDWIDGGIGLAWAVSGGVPGITTTRVPTWTRP